MINPDIWVMKKEMQPYFEAYKIIRTIDEGVAEKYREKLKEMEGEK